MRLRPLCISIFAPAGGVVRDLLDRAHRIAQRDVAIDGAVLDHREHQRGEPVAQPDRELAHVGVADDHVQAAVLLAIGVRLVARVDDRALDHRVERDLGLEEVGALRELVLAGMRAVLAADLARAAVDLARHEERHQVLDDLLEGRAAVHQVVLVRAVASCPCDRCCSCRSASGCPAAAPGSRRDGSARRCARPPSRGSRGRARWSPRGTSTRGARGRRSSARRSRASCCGRCSPAGSGVYFSPSTWKPRASASGFSWS